MPQIDAKRVNQYLTKSVLVARQLGQVWIAICDEAMSEPLFRFQNEVAIKSSIYVEECLKKTTPSIPFIDIIQTSTIYFDLIWPVHIILERLKNGLMNLCTSSKKTTIHQTFLRQDLSKILWGFLAHKVYEGGWQAKTEQQLVNRIKLQLKNSDASYYSHSWEEFGRNFGLQQTMVLWVFLKINNQIN